MTLEIVQRALTPEEVPTVTTSIKMKTGRVNGPQTYTFVASFAGVRGDIRGTVTLAPDADVPIAIEAAAIRAFIYDPPSVDRWPARPEWVIADTVGSTGG